MANNEIGYPFQATGHYWLEDSYGGGNSGTTYAISCYIQDARIGSGDRSKSIRDIGTADVTELMQLAEEPTLHVEYNPQVGDHLIEHAVELTSCCTNDSFAFAFKSNKCMPDSKNSEFYIVGAKPNTVRISGSKGEPWTVTMDFLCKSVVTVLTATQAVAADTLAGDILTFNLAGSITYAGTIVESAYVTNSVDISFAHNLTPYVGLGSSNPDFIVNGARDISGSCDITLDSGGAFHYGDVNANRNFTLTLAMGGAGAPKLTIPGCQWDKSEVDLNVSGEAMIESAPFTSAPQSCVSSCLTTIVSTV